MSSKDAAYNGRLHLNSGNWKSKKSVSSLKSSFHLSREAYDKVTKAFSGLSIGTLKHSSACIIELASGNPTKLAEAIRELYKGNEESKEKPKLELIKTPNGLIVAFQPFRSKKIAKRFQFEEKEAPQSAKEGVRVSFELCSAYGFEGIRQSFTKAVKRMAKENRLMDSDSELNSLFLGKTSLEINYEIGKKGVTAAEKCLKAIKFKEQSDQDVLKEALKFLKMIEVFKVLEIDMEFDSFKSLAPQMRKVFLNSPLMGQLIAWILNEPKDVRSHISEVCELVSSSSPVKLLFLCKKCIVFEASLNLEGLFDLANQFQHMVADPKEFAERLEKNVQLGDPLIRMNTNELEFHDSSIEVDHNLKNLMYQ